MTWGQRKRFADGKVNLPYKQFLGYRKGTDGLPEIVPDGRVGFVCRPDAAEVARAIDRIWRDDVLAGFRANMEEEKKRFSWDAMCDRITELYRLVK